MSLSTAAKAAAASAAQMVASAALNDAKAAQETADTEQKAANEAQETADTEQKAADTAQDAVYKAQEAATRLSVAGTGERYVVAKRAHDCLAGKLDDVEDRLYAAEREGTEEEVVAAQKEVADLERKLETAARDMRLAQEVDKKNEKKLDAMEVVLKEVADKARKAANDAYKAAEVAEAAAEAAEAAAKTARKKLVAARKAARKAVEMEAAKSSAGTGLKRGADVPATAEVSATPKKSRKE